MQRLRNSVALFFSASLVFAACRSGNTTANSAGEQNHVYTAIENKPFYPGGDAALAEFINSNIQYPEKAIIEEVEGKVYVSFIVNKEGKIASATIVKGLGGSIDEEVIRVINLIEGFKPATQHGKPVNYNYIMPISFTLPGLLPLDLHLKKLKLIEEKKAE